LEVLTLPDLKYSSSFYPKLLAIKFSADWLVAATALADLQMQVRRILGDPPDSPAGVEKR
jgi:hypothetical protein